MATRFYFPPVDNGLERLGAGIAGGLQSIAESIVARNQNRERASLEERQRKLQEAELAMRGITTQPARRAIFTEPEPEPGLPALPIGMQRDAAGVVGGGVGMQRRVGPGPSLANPMLPEMPAARIPDVSFEDVPHVRLGEGFVYTPELDVQRRLAEMERSEAARSDIERAIMLEAARAGFDRPTIAEQRFRQDQVAQSAADAVMDALLESGNANLTKDNLFETVLPAIDRVLATGEYPGVSRAQVLKHVPLESRPPLLFVPGYADLATQQTVRNAVGTATALEPIRQQQEQEREARRSALEEHQQKEKALDEGIGRMLSGKVENPAKSAFTLWSLAKDPQTRERYFERYITALAPQIRALALQTGYSEDEIIRMLRGEQIQRKPRPSVTRMEDLTSPRR